MRLLFFLPVLALLSGCGEKPSTGAEKEEPTDPASDPATPSAAGSPGKESSPPLLSDADVERLLKEAVDSEAGFEMGEDGGLVAPNGSGPFSGWIKFLDEYGKGLQRFKDGKMDGPDVFWHENGQKASEGTYKDGEEDGPMTEWYEDGRLASERTWDNGELVAVTVRMPNGDKCPNTKFENGSGTVYAYWENGQKKHEATYKDGQLDGLETRYYENGQKEFETTYKDGKEDGPQTQYYENGQKELEVTYKDGKEDGPQTQYYENGQKMREGTNKDGEKDGLETWWYENGQKMGERNYKDGQKVGERRYKDGVEVSAKYWNSKGEEVDSEEEAFK